MKLKISCSSQRAYLVSDGKESTHNVGNLGSVPGLVRSPGEENDYPLQYSKNSGS